MIELFVLVPRLGTPPGLLIDSGSGIVTAALADRVLVYYEGNRYDASNLRTFADRVLVAAGRLSAHYPTVARARFALADFTVVGTFTHAPDWREHRLHITDPTTVATWATEG